MLNLEANRCLRFNYGLEFNYYGSKFKTTLTVRIFRNSGTLSDVHEFSKDSNTSWTSAEISLPAVNDMKVNMHSRTTDLFLERCKQNYDLFTYSCLFFSIILLVFTKIRNWRIFSICVFSIISYKPFSNLKCKKKIKWPIIYDGLLCY